MLSSRALLIRQLQQFFELHLVGLYRWPGSELRAPEKQEKVRGRRQLDKEMVVVDFDGYSLLIKSPDDSPPLGEITLFDTRNGSSVKGILDEATWVRIADYIKEKAPLRTKENTKCP